MVESKVAGLHQTFQPKVVKVRMNNIDLIPEFWSLR